MRCWWKEMESMQCLTNCFGAGSITRRLNQETSGYHFNEYGNVGKSAEHQILDHKFATCFGACGVGCGHHQMINKMHFTITKAALYA